jgi:hypothetical protein
LQKCAEIRVWKASGYFNVVNKVQNCVLDGFKPYFEYLRAAFLTIMFITTNRLLWGLCCLSLFLGSACGGSDDKKVDRPVAKVYDKSLLASELEAIVPPGTADSALLATAYVRRWVSDQLLMYEAERNIPKDANIDQLVRDYRASLVRFKFEEDLIAQQLDSTVSESEVRRYYEANKELFNLESTILKCLVVKMPDNAPQNEFNKIWNSREDDAPQRLTKLANQQATLAMLDRQKWYKLEEVAAILPKGTLTADNVGSRREGTVSDGDFRYYYRVLDAVRGKETAPFDYVKAQASKVILHHRKQELLDRWKTKRYDEEQRRGNISIF